MYTRRTCRVRRVDGVPADTPAVADLTVQVLNYDANEGNRFLQGCYIDYDSTEGRLKHLKRKFNY